MAHGMMQAAFEETPVSGATLDEIDLQLVERHITQSTREGRLRASEGADSTMNFLSYHHCIVDRAGTIEPTVAGILFFGRHPQRWLPQAEFVLGHFPGETATSTQARHLQRYDGTLPDQILAVEGYIEGHMERGFSVEEGPQRRERPQFPLVVLREMLVNAAGHRDYSLLGASIRVSLFPNKVEVASPGGPPVAAPLEGLMKTSHARNRILMRLLWQVRFCEAFGLGLRTILTTMEREGLPAPEIDTAAANFFLSIRGHQPTGLNMAIVEQLTEPQLVLLRALTRQGSLTPRQASLLLPLRSERSIRNDFNALVELGVILRMGETRAVSYRLAGDVLRLPI
jgi:ATP-dependent DNA helicase RecG